MKNILIGLLLMAAAQNAVALQNIKVGGVEVKPVVSVKQSYDSNIYLDDVTPKASNITRSAAGVNLVKMFGSRLDLKAGYLYELLNYSRAPGINDAKHHTANLALDARLQRNTTLTIKDDFTQTTDQATSELDARTKRLQNTVAITADSPLRGNFGYGFNVQHTYHNYNDLAYSLLDRTELLAGFNVNYKLQPKTKVFLGYTYGTLRYVEKNSNTNTRANDAIYNNFDLGITGSLGPKLTGTIAAGAQLRHYNKDLSTAKNNVTTGGYSAQLLWKPVEKTEVVLYGKRANVENSGGDSRFYTSTLNDISVAREVKKIRLGAGASFETVQYPERTTAASPKRVDENVNARVTVDYNIQKWLQAGVSYTYKNRASNESDKTYKDNIAGLQLKGMF